jgi:hypothetical protein
VVIPFPAVRLPGHSGNLGRIEEALDGLTGRDATRMDALFERRARQPGEPKPHD